MMYQICLWTMLSLSSLVSATSAAAQSRTSPDLPDVKAPCAPEVLEARRGVTTIAGQVVVWFQKDVATCMGQRLEALPLYADRVRLLESKLELEQQRSLLLQQTADLAVKAQLTAESALTKSEWLNKQLENKLDAWYRKPGLWFAFGAVATIAAIIAVPHVAK